MSRRHIAKGIYWGLYVRVSTDRQGEDGTSLATQEAGCRALAADRGFAIDETHVYRETHTGTELWERPRLTELREAIRTGRIAGVVCYAIDRLARDPVHLGVVLSEAQHAGAVVEFVAEPLDDTPEGQLIRFVRGYAAKVEHEKIRERTIRGKRARVQSGKLHNHASELYGYRRNKELGVRIIEESEAAIVRRIFRWSLEGVSTRTIYKRLNDDGVSPPSVGKLTFKDGRTPRWGRGVISRMLSEPAYKGDTYAWRFRHVSKPGERMNRPPEEWIQLPEGTTPAIVTPEVWDAVNNKSASRAADTTRNATRPHLLRGHIFCAVCGQRMSPQPEHGTYVYRCSSRDRASGPCGGKRVQAKRIEPVVWERVAAVLRDPSLIIEEIERRRAEGPDRSVLADLETIDRSLAKVERQQDRLIQRMADDDDESFPWELIRRQIAQLEDEKKTLRASRAAIERRIAEHESATKQLDFVVRHCTAVGRLLDNPEFETKRVALAALDVRVISNGSNPDDWSITGSIPVPSLPLADPENAGVLPTTCLCRGRRVRARRC